MNPDRELWEKLPKNDNYEFIPITTAVAKVLVRKKGDKVLLAHYVKDRDKKVIVMHYVRNEGGWLSQHGGYSWTPPPEVDVKSALVQLAESIATDWPEYAVRHRKVKYKKI